MASWAQGPNNALDTSVELDALRARLRAMTDDELLKFGRQIRSLCHPLTYDGDGKPNVGAFPIQLDEAAQGGMVEALDHRVAATKDGFVYSLPT
jgi:hypothetical protein